MADTLSIARPYAKAAFEAAAAHNQLALWATALKELSIAVRASEVIALLKNPNISKEARCELLAVFAKEKSIQNFLKLLAEKDRLLVLPEISVLFEAFLAKGAGYLALSVTSAFVLDDTQKQAIEKKLEKQLNIKVNIEFHVDAQLIGGILVRSGDWVMDATILGKLKKLKSVIGGE